MTRVFLTMTTIPSRCNDPEFLDNILFLNQQETRFEKLFLVVPARYKRFSEIIDDQHLEKIVQACAFVDVIRPEMDHGPASKFMGPLLHRYDEIQDSILIVLDDDRKYHPRMISLYVDCFKDHPKSCTVSGNPSLYMSTFQYQRLSLDFLDIREAKQKYVSGFMSFALHLERYDFRPLIGFTNDILTHVPSSFFHDEGILQQYFWFSGIQVLYINFRMVEYRPVEFHDALCNHDSNHERRQIEHHIYQYLSRHFLLSYSIADLYPRSRLRKLWSLGS